MMWVDTLDITGTYEELEDAEVSPKLVESVSMPVHLRWSPLLRAESAAKADFTAWLRQRLPGHQRQDLQQP
jgi:hypothetical protein